LTKTQGARHCCFKFLYAQANNIANPTKKAFIY